MPPLFRTLAATLLVVSVAITHAFGSALPAGGYSIRTWQTEDGLPLNALSSAVQTHDGYLWIGTYAGLARFDGKSFVVFNGGNTPTLQDGRISCLFEDSEHTLWIGHESGLISRYRDNRFETFALHEGMAREKVTAIGSDENGRVWAMRENGVIDAVDGSVRLPSLLAGEPPQIMSWTRSSRGEIWVSENGRLARLANGKLSTYPVSTDNVSDYVLCATPSAAGGVWLLCGGKDVRRWQDGQWVETRPYPAPPGPVSCCLELRDGTVALGTMYSGLYLLFKDGRPPVHFDQSNGLPQNWVCFLYEDREGNLWAGSGSAGLVAIHQSPFEMLAPPDQWQGRSVISVAAGPDRSLWVGTEGAGLYHFAKGVWTRYGEAEGLENLFIWAVTESADGAVWVGNYRWGGPYRLVDGRFLRPPKLDPNSSAVLALEASRSPHEILIGNREGLLRLTEDGSNWLYKSPEGTNADVCAVVRGKDGVIWFGLTQDGLGRYENGQVSIFRREDGLSSNAVQCLHFDHAADALWIGTADGGLNRLKNGKFGKLGIAQGFVDEAVCHILDDERGSIWLSSHRGIQQYEKAALEQCADGTTGWVVGKSYDRNHGLPTIEFTGARQGTGAKTSDGRLLFASSKGLVTIDPTRIQRNPTPPPVAIEALSVDGKSVPFENGRIEQALPPSNQRLEFHYTGLSFVAPGQVMFRYKLEGIDTDWVNAGDFRTAYYSHLPAGSYRFRVIARNEDEVWNFEGAALTFTVAPYFWQTWWFVGLCALAVLSAVTWVVRSITRRRMLRRMQELERLHAIERERARIARDIHDDLGGNLTHIAILSQPTREKIREPDQAANVLSGIYRTARDGIRALDEIVWAVDPQHDTLDSLVSYMGKYAQDFLEPAQIVCRLDFPLDLPAWPLGAEIRHNLFLAFKETLNNTLKHAGATEVRISLSLEPQAFRLIIKDNGRGFRPSAAQPAEQGRITGGHGLPNLERRLAGIGGRCEIKTSPTEGTEVAFIMSMPTPSIPAESSPSPTAPEPSAPLTHS